MGTLFLAGEDGVAHGLEMGLGLGTVVIVGRAAPEGLFIELDFLDVRTAIDHRTEVGVSNRQGL